MSPRRPSAAAAVSNRSRGRELERRAAKLLTDAGWSVHLTQSTPTRKVMGPATCPTCHQPKQVQWISRSNDLFNCFDLLAVCDFTMPMLVQVCWAGSAERRRKIEEWVRSSPGGVTPYGVTIAVWQWNGGRVSKRSRVAGKWTVYRLHMELDAPTWAKRYATPAELQDLMAA